MSRRHDTRDPRQARTRALKLLYQADVRGQSPAEALQAMAGDPVAVAMLDDVDAVAELDEAAEIEAQARADAAADSTDRPAGPDVRLDGFSRALVLGVDERLDEIDALIGRHARNWTVSRMPVVDRCVLRLATYELLDQPTRPAVVINEALELAKGLSTESSSRYVNGVLESVRKDIAASRESSTAE